MEKMIKLTALMFIVVGLAACGKMGELEAVKASAPTADNTPTPTAENTIAPELDILPHNSK
jgi:predicted small lipoprotein YifL